METVSVDVGDGVTVRFSFPGRMRAFRRVVAVWERIESMQAAPSPDPVPTPTESDTMDPMTA